MTRTLNGASGEATSMIETMVSWKVFLPSYNMKKKDKRTEKMPDNSTIDNR